MTTTASESIVKLDNLIINKLHIKVHRRRLVRIGFSSSHPKRNSRGLFESSKIG